MLYKEKKISKFKRKKKHTQILDIERNQIVTMIFDQMRFINVSLSYEYVVVIRNKIKAI